MSSAKEYNILVFTFNEGSLPYKKNIHSTETKVQFFGIVYCSSQENTSHTTVDEDYSAYYCQQTADPSVSLMHTVLFLLLSFSFGRCFVFFFSGMH